LKHTLQTHTVPQTPDTHFKHTLLHRPQTHTSNTHFKHTQSMCSLNVCNPSFVFFSFSSACFLYLAPALMSFVAEQNKSESLSNDETFQASATLVHIAGT